MVFMSKQVLRKDMISSNVKGLWSMILANPHSTRQILVQDSETGRRTEAVIMVCESKGPKVMP